MSCAYIAMIGKFLDQTDISANIDKPTHEQVTPQVRSSFYGKFVVNAGEQSANTYPIKWFSHLLGGKEVSFWGNLIIFGL